MWEGDRVEVDPVGPWVGLGLAALLCVVLTGLSAEGVSVGDVFHAGRPIATTVAPPTRADVRTGGGPVQVPTELRAGPVGAVLGSVDAARPTGASDAVRAEARARSHATRRRLPPRGGARGRPRGAPPLR